ncbi:MAG TPA: amidohydrolase family protein, partial [Candidatus Polarisedimenticolaceae bacterium]|nr:amidohydrolase family protein [Candidatus Polarisedimenticolaceae bacterium]
PRLKAVALVPFQDVPEAVKELRRAVNELKLPGVMLPAVGLRLPLGHESFWPIYEEAERLDCMVGIHATVRGPHYFAADMFDQFIEVHTLSHSFAQMMQCTSMMFRGVFDRFPKLRVAFMEAGCSWAPYWFGRMNEEWEKRGAVEAPKCKKKPTEYFKEGRIYFHAEDYEPLIGATSEVISHNVIYYASDYPHWDTEFPENIEHLVRRKDLNDEAKKWLLAESAKKLYNFS